MKNVIIVILIACILALFTSCLSKRSDEKREEHEMLVHIKNNKGEVKVKSNNLSNIILDDVGSIKGEPIIISSKDFKGIAAACPFDNEITISKNEEEITKLWIAGDDCRTVLKQDRTVVEISDNTYNKIEEAMKENKNSLAEHKR
ncbi:MAG TPA: hypothetical protein VIO64_02625 [Pseudobacteroides sp.]|uniref:hypothetical protein n=1 Tax=Pseudobacteroides sp. TaxID=1968840 RepID=UPI002F925C24